MTDSITISQALTVTGCVFFPSIALLIGVPIYWGVTGSFHSLEKASKGKDPHDERLRNKMQKHIQQHHPGEELRGHLKCHEVNWKSIWFGVFFHNTTYIGLTDKRFIIIPVCLTGKQDIGDTSDILLEQVIKFEHKPFLSRLQIHYDQITKRRFDYVQLLQVENAKHLEDTFNSLHSSGLNQAYVSKCYRIIRNNLDS